MYILICGGCGFIGINLCRELLKRGKKIICLDNCKLMNYFNLSKSITLSKYFSELLL